MLHLCVLQAQVDRDAMRLATQAPLLTRQNLPDEGIGVTVAVGEFLDADTHGRKLAARGMHAIGIEPDRASFSSRSFGRDRIGQHVSSPTNGYIRAQRSLVLVNSQDLSTKIKEAGKRLREERTRLGFNQADFAALGGVSLNTQTRYETGSGTADMSYLLSVAGHGVDVAYVVTGRRFDAQLEPEEGHFLATARQLSPEQITLLVQFINSLQAQR